MPTEFGDADVALKGEILKSTVGSQLYGTALDETGDNDEMAIYIDSPESVLGFLPQREDYVWRTVEEGERSGPDDTDFISYSLQKYLKLATNGNPTMLLPLFAPDDMLLTCTIYGTELRALRSHFLSQKAVHRFLGYMRSQKERMLGQSKRHVPNRPELVEKYGYDTKYASHALRLSLQGLEMASKGTLTLPMRQQERDWVVAVKRGEVKKDRVVVWCDRLQDETNALLETGQTPLNPEPNIPLITEWAVEAQRNFWGWIAQPPKDVIQ